MKLSKKERVLAAEALFVAAWSPKLALNKPQQRLVVSCMERLTGAEDAPVWGRVVRKFLARKVRPFYEKVHQKAGQDFPNWWSRWRSPNARRMYKTYVARTSAVEKFFQEVLGG